MIGPRQALVAATLAFVVGVVAACGGPGTERIEIGIASLAFTPDTVHARVGDTLTWVNRDLVPHTVSGPFESGPMLVGDSFSVTATRAGSFPYVCAYHPGMTGTVEVAGSDQ